MRHSQIDSHELHPAGQGAVLTAHGEPIRARLLLRNGAGEHQHIRTMPHFLWHGDTNAPLMVRERGVTESAAGMAPSISGRGRAEVHDPGASYSPCRIELAPLLWLSRTLILVANPQQEAASKKCAGFLQ